jgi:hypothetical protein
MSTPPPTPAKQQSATPTGNKTVTRRGGKRARREAAQPPPPPVQPEQDPAGQRWDIEPLPVSPLVCASLEHSRDSAPTSDPYDEMFYSLDLHEDNAFKDFVLYDDDFRAIRDDLKKQNGRMKPCDFPSEITALGTTAFGLEQYKEQQMAILELRQQNTRMRHELQRGVDVWKSGLERACEALQITAGLLQQYRDATPRRMAGEAENQYLQSAEYRKAMSTCAALGMPCITSNARLSKEQKTHR